MRTQRRVRRPLFVEELERRLVLSTVLSANWAGYAVTAPPGLVAAVSGNWTVPAVAGPGTSFSSAWVGIDGVNSPTVEQIGTEQDVINGVPQYSAWYEMYPSYPVYLPQAVQAGDSISASVRGSDSGDFTLEIKDTTANWAYSTTQSLPGAQRSSAEWVVEAPATGFGILPLANFGSVTFSQASVTLGTTTPATGAAIDKSSGQDTAINLASRSGTQATTSALTDAASPATSSFTVTDIAASSTGTGPATPTSPTPSPRSRHHHRGQTNAAVSQPVTTPATTTTSPTGGTAAGVIQQTPLPVILAPLQPVTQPAAVLSPSTVVAPPLPPSSAPTAAAAHGPGLSASYPDGGGTDQPDLADVPPADKQPAAGDAAPPDGRAMPERGHGARPAPGRAPKPGAPKAPAPTPAPAPDDMPADRQVDDVTWRRARDAYFLESRWDRTALKADAAGAIGRVGEEGTAAVPVAGLALALTLGGCWRVTAEETEIRRRRWRVR